MAADNFIYQGINRAVSDYTGTRACEELINLRPTDGGVVPVKDFSAFLTNVGYDRIYVHHATDGDHYIVIWKSSLGVTAQVLGGADGKTPLTPILFNVSANSAAKQQRVIDNLFFAAAGNVILFSVRDTVDGTFENHSFIRKANDNGVMTYIEMEATDPEVSFSVEDDYQEGNETKHALVVWQKIAHLGNSSTVDECADAVQSGLNAIQEENPSLCLGPIIIAVAYKTKDGNTFWTKDWKLYDPVPAVRSDSDSPYVSEDDVPPPSSYFDRFFDKYHFGYLAGMTHGDHLEDIFAYGTNVRVEFDRVNNWSEGTSIIQSVEVYSSRPQLYLDSKGARDGLFELSPEHPSDDDYQLFLPQTKYEEMDMGGQLLYHQASIPMASLAESSQTVNLTFGGAAQLTEDTLDTDAGALKRYGKVLAYNARFHYYDSVSSVEVGSPDFAKNRTGTDEMAVLVRYSDNERTALMYIDDAPTDDYDVKANIVIAPSINIKEVITCHKNGTYWDVKKYRMTASSSYNYSVCDGGPYFMRTLSASEWSGSEMEEAISAGKKNELWSNEPDAINVSEQYNPFVFLVEHSYKAPGNIIDVQPQMAGITDSSYGRDPLNVFTERGLYALTQGSANVLYGAFLPVSQLVVNRSAGAVPTEQGIFFLADGGLWLVSGRRAALISEALSLGPHKYIRESTGYRKLSGDETTGTEIVPYYDVSPYLSKVEFKYFVDGNGDPESAQGRLSYNRFRMELIVSNKDYDYSYVLSLKYRQWFKLSKKIWQDELGSNLISTPGATLGNIDVLDLRGEVDGSVLVHLQSRPFSMGYSYSHVHRIVAMVRARLQTSADKIAVGLYGSDDLQHWKLLAYAKRSGSTTTSTVNEQTVTNNVPLFLSQLRTPSSARSWRYYTVCIGGEIPVDADFPTDFGPVIVDYEPVIRRIG